MLAESIQSDALKRWGELGASLRAARKRNVRWDAVTRIVEAAKRTLAPEAEKLRQLLLESRKRLDPFDDPLLTDIGVHRWLAPHREEAYSDWLAWIVEQFADSPPQLFELFDLAVPPGAGDWTKQCMPEICREVWVDDGHAGREGRLDLVVHYRDLGLLVVEVKKYGADGADTGKHAGYRGWIEARRVPESCKSAVLLARNGNEESYEGFKLRSWGTLCQNLRRMASRESRPFSKLAVAMALAFVGAVEQNLLGLSSAAAQQVVKGQTLVFNTNLVRYLEETLADRVSE